MELPRTIRSAAASCAPPRARKEGYGTLNTSFWWWNGAAFHLTPRAGIGDGDWPGWPDKRRNNGGRARSAAQLGAVYSAPAGRAALNDLRGWPLPCLEAN